MKKIIAIALALVLVLSFAACSNESAENVIKVGASPAPHAEILEVAKEVLAADGWTLEIVEFTDYVLPNETLTAGEIDANYFQHTPYQAFIQSHRTRISGNYSMGAFSRLSRSVEKGQNRHRKCRNHG